MGLDACFARCAMPALGPVIFGDCHLQEQFARLSAVLEASLWS
jgi:hypothetical protein